MIKGNIFNIILGMKIIVKIRGVKNFLHLFLKTQVLQTNLKLMPKQ